jgi:hypothetical protein
MAQVGTLVDRLDITIEKLTEVSTRVSELLAVQGTRLENQEKVSEQIQGLIETRRLETDSNFKDVYLRVERVEKDLYTELESFQDKLLAEIKELRADTAQNHEELKTQVNQVEKWMWTCIGAVALLSFVIQIGVNFIP